MLQSSFCWRLYGWDRATGRNSHECVDIGLRGCCENAWNSWDMTNSMMGDGCEERRQSGLVTSFSGSRGILLNSEGGRV